MARPRQRLESLSTSSYPFPCSYDFTSSADSCFCTADCKYIFNFLNIFNMLVGGYRFTDAPSRSIGAMNRVNFTARFVLKTLMTMSPGTVLLTFTASFWMTAAWIMLLCERYQFFFFIKKFQKLHGFFRHHGYGNSAAFMESNRTINYEATKHQVNHESLFSSYKPPIFSQNYLNSLWLVAITSLTIGYGDIVPNTYCGRLVSVICGIMVSFLKIHPFKNNFRFSRVLVHLR